MKVLITGCSSGLGAALAAYYREEGAEVYGLSRRIPEDTVCDRFASCDLGDPGTIETALSALLRECRALDVVYLNAGTLGRIQDMSACGLDELKQQMDVNLWANKLILDYMIKHRIKVGELIAISSGASQSGSLGWNGYSLSKAALNMLIKLYANEMPGTHCTALAPGLIETPMLGSILTGNHDTTRYTTVTRLRQSKEQGLVHPPLKAAALIDGCRKALRSFESGSYVDIRDL